jgi:hypothetical protein
MLPKILFGVWFSISILLMAFLVWIDRIWFGNNILWVLGFPFVSLMIAGCVMFGAITGSRYLLLFGFLAYFVMLADLIFVQLRSRELIVLIVNILLICVVAKILDKTRLIR